MCDVDGCDSEPIYLDPMENELCEECMVIAVESDSDVLYEHFTSIKGEK